jgi:hypothetical protein
MVSLSTKPHLGIIIFEPQGRPTVVVTEHIRPDESVAVILDVPWSALAKVPLARSARYPFPGKSGWYSAYSGDL